MTLASSDIYPFARVVMRICSILDIYVVAGVQGGQDHRSLHRFIHDRPIVILSPICPWYPEGGALDMPPHHWDTHLVPLFLLNLFILNSHDSLGSSQSYL